MLYRLPYFWSPTSRDDVEDAGQVLGAQLVPPPAQQRAVVAVGEWSVASHAAAVTADALEGVNSSWPHCRVVEAPVEPGGRRISFHVTCDEDLLPTGRAVHPLLTHETLGLDCAQYSSSLIY